MKAFIFFKILTNNYTICTENLKEANFIVCLINSPQHPCSRIAHLIKKTYQLLKLPIGNTREGGEADAGGFEFAVACA